MNTITINRRGEIPESTLPLERQEKLREAFLGSPWYIDRWSRKKFRETLVEMLAQDPDGGLIVIHDILRLKPPPPFHDMFEPIPLDGPLGDDSQQMRALTGDQSTRQERMQRIGLFLIGMLVVCALVPLLTFAIIGRTTLPLMVFLGYVVMTVVVVFLIKYLTRLAARWYVVPGGVVIVKNSSRRGPRIELRSRRDTVVVIRLVSTGKSTFRMVELLTPDGRRLHRAVSERESMALLAGWASDHPLPTVDMLEAAVG